MMVGAHEVAEPIRPLRLGPGFDCPFRERKCAIRDGQIHAEIDGVAESLAAGTRARGTVETEQNGFRLTVIDVAEFAGELLVEAQTLLGTGVLKEDFGRFAVTDFNRVHQALAQVGRDGDAVREDKNGLLEIDFEKGFRGRELKRAAVLVEAAEAFPAEFEQARLQVFIGGALHGLKQNVPARPGALGEHLFRNAIDRIALHPASAVVAECPADARVEQAQKIEAFGGSRDGGAGVARRGFLADGDGRRDAVDFVDIRFLHAFEKLACVGGKGFDITPLALRVDGVEGERAFPRPGYAGDYGELVMRNRARCS